MIVSHFWHSFLGHPLMALCHLVGATRLGNWVHDSMFAEPFAYEVYCGIDPDSGADMEDFRRQWNDAARKLPPPLVRAP